MCICLGKIICDGGGFVRVVLIPEFSHTDGILEQPLKGDNTLLLDMLRQLENLDHVRKIRTRIRQSTITSSRKTHSSRKYSHSTTSPSNNHHITSSSINTSSYARDTSHNKYTNTSTWFIEDLRINTCDYFDTSSSSVSSNNINTTTTISSTCICQPNTTSRAVLSIGLPLIAVSELKYQNNHSKEEQMSWIASTTFYIKQILVNIAKTVNPF